MGTHVVTKDDLANLAHMVGKDKMLVGMRNYWASDEHSKASMERLVASGLCYRGRSYMKDGRYYHCSRAGCEKLGLTPEQTARALEAAREFS